VFFSLKKQSIRYVTTSGHGVLRASFYSVGFGTEKHLTTQTILPPSSGYLPAGAPHGAKRFASPPSFLIICVAYFWAIAALAGIILAYVRVLGWGMGRAR